MHITCGSFSDAGSEVFKYAVHYVWVVVFIYTRCNPETLQVVLKQAQVVRAGQKEGVSGMRSSIRDSHRQE